MPKGGMPSLLEESLSGEFLPSFRTQQIWDLISIYSEYLPYCFVGFAFIYMDDERDADYAIRGLDRREFGRKGRRLRVEWSKVSSVSALLSLSVL